MENKPRYMKRINIVLTILFLAFIMFIFCATLATDFVGLYDHARLMVHLDDYLDDDWNALDLFSARISSVSEYLNQCLFLKEEMGWFNSSLQYAIGKNIVTTGGAEMATLTTGHLYDLTKSYDMTERVNELVELRDSLPEDLPFLYVYDHPTVYSEDMFPDGFTALDRSDDNADQLISLLNENGIPTIDSREVINASGLGYDELLFYTDQHWTALSALVMSKSVVEWMNENVGFDLDPQLLDLSNFESYTYDKLFLGKYGQRIGTWNIDPDDITLYWPTYDTDITRYTLNNGNETTVRGEFYDSVIKHERLVLDEGRDYSTSAYMDYGLTEDMEIYTNHNVDNDITVMVLKDSFASPICAFTSLSANKVIGLDMRKLEGSVLSYVEEYDPDILIVAYSQKMLTDFVYHF